LHYNTLYKQYTQVERKDEEEFLEYIPQISSRVENGEVTRLIEEDEIK